jgi:hypothetical protein
MTPCYQRQSHTAVAHIGVRKKGGIGADKSDEGQLLDIAER